MKHLIMYIVGVFIFSGCEVKNKDNLTMARSNVDFSNYCVGRSSINIPSSYQLADGTSGSFKFNGTSDDDSSIAVVVSKTTMDQAKFSAEINRRRAALKAAADETTDIFRHEEKLAAEAVLFRINRIDDAYVSEINFLRGPAFVTATIKSWDEKFLDAESVLEKFVQGVQLRVDGSSGAFCLGPVSVSGNFSEETGNYLFVDTVQRGNSLNLDIDTFRPDEKISLLQRMSGPDSLLTKFQSDHKVIRAKKTSFANMNGEEWLGSIKLGEPEHPKKFKFVLESTRSAPSRLAPYFHLSFETGKTLDDGNVDKTIISDDEAVRQWDAIVASVQPMKP